MSKLWLLDIIEIITTQPWALRALFASMMVGITCGVIGCFMVLRNMSLIGDALSHAILPGIFFAFLLVGYSDMGFLVGTLVAAIVSVLAMTWIQENVMTKNDAAIGIVFTFMFSIGVIGISYLNNSDGGVHLDLMGFLFGTILGVGNEDLVINAVVTTIAIASIVIFYRPLFITTFQVTIAKAMGVRAKLIHYLLMLLLSIAIVAALRTVGIILVVAMLITPAATALLLTHRLHYMLIIAGGLGALSAFSGLVIAIMLNTTPGPAMCVMATIFYLLAVFFSPRKGLVPKFFKRHKQKRAIHKEDIIKGIFQTGKPLGARQLADRLQISPQLAHRLCKNLIQKQLLTQVGNEYSLTTQGKERAKELVRAHRLWETFLADKVGLTEDKLHADAEKYEHLLSPEMLDRLDARLGFPVVDPHGSPIPNKSASEGKRLFGIRVNEVVYIATEQLNENIESKLFEMGLAAEMPVTVTQIHENSIEISTQNQARQIPYELARKIIVQ